MGRSHRLRLSDVRAIFRLLGEIRELGHDPPVWKRHMLESLCRVVGGQAGISGEVLFRAGVPRTVPESVVDFCISNRRGWEALVRFPTAPEARSCPVFCAMTRWQPGGSTTNFRREYFAPICDRRTWRDSALIRARNLAELEDHMFSQYALPTGCAVHVISLNRVVGEKPFNRKVTRLVDLFHAELSRIWRVSVANDVPPLSPRLRQTLDRLLAGDCEKQIAAQLGLSRHTVHNYVKELHHRFAVSSRSELIGRCVKMNRGEFAPRLTTTLDDLFTLPE